LEAFGYLIIAEALNINPLYIQEFGLELGTHVRDGLGRGSRTLAFGLGEASNAYREGHEEEK
jgi:hypothetical protein